MILTNRLFNRNLPSREAKSIYIFCEGKDREYRYFYYFREMDSRINIEIYKLNSHEDNSPQGLFKIAINSIVEDENNPNPKYAFQENDEVWIVLDTDKDKDDSRKAQIEFIRKNIIDKKDWFIVESNPCFEVWLYYHFYPTIEKFEGIEKSKNWKSYVDANIKGGFDPRKHPIYIERATINAENNFKIDENSKLNIGTTEIFKLSKSILTIIKSKIKEVLEKFE
jgi:hypothetical protein